MKIFNQFCKLGLSCALLTPLVAFADFNTAEKFEKKTASRN